VAEPDGSGALSAGVDAGKREMPDRSKARTSRKRANLREKRVLI
jgi:hypothetical protein